MAAEVRYRSPLAVIIWWLWALFALAVLIDLAVQGRDRFSLEFAANILVITGVVYNVALRPRIVADESFLTVVNPLRVHRIDWLSVTAVDARELVRIRCAWDPAGKGGTGSARARVIHAWAVQASRRRQAAMRVRAGRRASRGLGMGGRGFGGGPAGGQFPAGSPGWRTPAAAPAAGPGGLTLDADHVVAELTKRAEQAHSAGPAGGAVPPRSRWDWPAVAAIAAPALALILIALLLGRARSAGARRPPWSAFPRKNVSGGWWNGRDERLPTRPPPVRGRRGIRRPGAAAA